MVQASADAARTSPGRLRGTVDAIFGVDLRSLALFRIGLAGVLLYDLLDRSRSVGAHYVDPGAVPVSVLPVVTTGSDLSLHVWVAGSAAAQWGLLAAAAAAGIALALGFQARIAALVSWGLLSSLQVRNPIVSWEGADNLLRILLLWAALAPVGARFSLDARRARAAGRPPTADRLCTPATAVLVLQVCAVYWITGMAKTGELWANGQALAYALRLDYFRSTLADWLLPFDGLLGLMSHVSRYAELFACFLLFVPWRTWIFRLLVMGLFYGFHVGIWLLMSVGMFSPLSMVMWLPLLPSQAWDALPRLRATAAPSDASPWRTPRWVEGPAAAFALFLAVSIVSNALIYAGARGIPLGPADRVVSLLRIRQSWPMFSPSPPAHNRWPIVRGTLANGTLVDPFRGGPVLEEPPPSLAAYYPSFKWKLHFYWLVREYREQEFLLWSYLIDHWCREWNATHPPAERLVRVDVSLRVQEISPDPERPGKVETQPIPGHVCSPDQAAASSAVKDSRMPTPSFSRSGSQVGSAFKPMPSDPS